MCLVLDLSLLVSTFFLVPFPLWLPVELHVKLGPDLVPSFCVLSPKFQFYRRFLLSCPLGSRRWRTHLVLFFLADGTAWLRSSLAFYPWVLGLCCVRFTGTHVAFGFCRADSCAPIFLGFIFWHIFGLALHQVCRQFFLRPSLRAAELLPREFYSVLISLVRHSGRGANSGLAAQHRSVSPVSGFHFSSCSWFVLLF
jgi:hypothetical protein